jgi:hypothetical protein
VFWKARDNGSLHTFYQMKNSDVQNSLLYELPWFCVRPWNIYALVKLSLVSEEGWLGEAANKFLGKPIYMI